MANITALDNRGNSDAGEVVEKLCKTFRSNKTKPLTWRKTQLLQLLKLINENEEKIGDAVAKDLGKTFSELKITELFKVESEIINAVNELESWTGRTAAGGGLLYALDRAYTEYLPLGVVCIMTPWNYPVSLLLIPLVSAIAAGNCCLLKPSELAPETASVLKQLLEAYLDTAAIAVFLGGVPETTVLLKQKFDHIFFTGSSRVGKIVMQAAAEHLTPVTLELGGKSPCIVDRDVSLKLAARRIVFGKLMNSGQTCIAVDYLLCFPDQLNDLARELECAVREHYSSEAGNPNVSNTSRIVNKAHFDRLSKLVECELSSKDNLLLFGGKTDSKTLRIEPTAIYLGPLSHLESKINERSLMKEEIFGPILPVLTIESIEEAVDFVNNGQRPLACYLFTNSKASRKYVLQNTLSGGVCVNDTLVQFACPKLPFGGVGNSGFGQSHGFYGFKAFSHCRATLERPLSLLSETMNAIRYPPLSLEKLKLIKKFTVPTVRGFSTIFTKNYLIKALIVSVGLAFAVKNYA